MARPLVGSCARADAFRGDRGDGPASFADARLNVDLSALGYAVLAGAANILGAAAVTARTRWSESGLDALLAFSAGFMVSVGLLDLIPHAIEEGGSRAAFVVLLGYLLVHLTQHTLAPHFHFGEEKHSVTQAVGWSALAGLLLHTFIDGVAIASGFAVSNALGILVFFAIMLHKVPEGVAISSLFLAAGASRKRAVTAATALAAATVLGVLFTGLIEPLARHGLALAGGVTLYVGASNLVPEFQAKPGWRLPVAFFAGCAIYVLARQLLPG
jgi:ZIP family zinc transporter/zinc and cadmium transporter